MLIQNHLDSMQVFQQFLFNLLLFLNIKRVVRKMTPLYSQMFRPIYGHLINNYKQTASHPERKSRMGVISYDIWAALLKYK